MDPASQKVEDKLNKSLEDLIKEQQQVSRGAGRGSSARGSDRGSGRGAARAGRGGSRRPKPGQDDAMDTDEAGGGRSGRRVDTSVLKTRGGIGKTQVKGRGVRGSTDGPPRGNVDQAWAHDQYNDDGPDRPRKVAGAGRRQQMQRQVANMSVVRISNLPAQVTKNDMYELLALVDEPIQINLTAPQDDGSRTCEAHMQSEEAARGVQTRYTDCALDGRPLRVQLAGTAARTLLSSGLAVEKVRSAPGGGAAALQGSGGMANGGGGSARPRGRGAQKGRAMHGF